MATDTKPSEGGGYDWAAGQLMVTPRAVMSLVKAGKLGYLPVSVGGRRKRFLPEHIEEYKRKNSRTARKIY